MAALDGDGEPGGPGGLPRRGQRVRNWSDLPENLRQEIATNYPGFDAAPPVDDDRRNETSWTYFKKRLEAREGEGDTKKSGGL